MSKKRELKKHPQQQRHALYDEIEVTFYLDWDAKGPSPSDVRVFEQAAYSFQTIGENGNVLMIAEPVKARTHLFHWSDVKSLKLGMKVTASGPETETEPTETPDELLQKEEGGE